MHDSPSEIHVGIVRVDEQSDPALLALASVLQEDERRKLSLLHKNVDQLNFAVGRLLARRMLDQVADAPATGWLFEQSATGKPGLHSRHAAKIDFSIAHTSGMIAVAVCKDRTVGIDVENTKTAVDMHGIAGLCFVPAEAERLRDEDAHKRADLFFSLWVMKEACSKAQQTGLFATLCDMSAHLDALVGDGPAVLQVQTWTVRRSRPSTEHRLAVAVQNEYATHRLSWVEHEVHVQDLLQKS